MNIKIIFLFALISFMAGCSEDPAGPAQSANPKNCKTPCLSTAPDLDKTSITASTGDTIVMTLTIAGDASKIDVASSYMTLEPVSTSNGQGKISTATNGVVNVNAGTYTVNFVIPVGSVTGEFYPKIRISIGGDTVNSVTYLFNSTTSQSNYAFEEHVNGDGSTYSSNGTYLGYVATDLVIPKVTLQ